MDVQVVKSKSQTALVFYAPDEKFEAAKAAVSDMKAVLNKHGFIVEAVLERVSSRNR